MEGSHLANTGELLEFSAQQLVDCNVKFNNGCRGGHPIYAYRYYENTSAILNDSYPFVSNVTGERSECRSDEMFMTDVNSMRYFGVKSGDIDAMKLALNFNPVSAMVEANKRFFKNYKSGVLATAKCGTTVDHSVLIVGWG